MSLFLLNGFLYLCLYDVVYHGYQCIELSNVFSSVRDGEDISTAAAARQHRSDERSHIFQHFSGSSLYSVLQMV